MLRYLFHVTKKSNLPSILRDGLVPKAGQNALSAGDLAPGVYLCERRQAAVWARILDADLILKVRTAQLDGIIVNDYDSLREYVHYGPIPADQIVPCDVAIDPAEARRTCRSYALCVSENVVALLRTLARKRPDPATLNAQLATVSNMAGIMERLPWEHANVKTILRAINREGREGEYTMCDEYMNTGKKFWECLDDPRIPDGARLKAVLLDKLGPAFPTLHTGGWEGPEYDV